MLSAIPNLACEADLLKAKESSAYICRIPQVALVGEAVQ